MYVRQVSLCSFVRPSQLPRRRSFHLCRSRFGRSSPNIDSSRSDLVLQETALFLYQLQYDTRLQQAMTMEAYDIAKNFKTQRDEVDSLVEKFQTAKGPKSGAAPLSDEFIDDTTTGLNLRLDLSKAIEEERYEEAAALRDAISKLTSKIENSKDESSEISTEIVFQLGQLVQHTQRGYRGVVCGWDLACCESKEWQRRASIRNLSSAAAQPFYHVLVDEREWPAYTRGPPVAYLAQEELRLMEGVEAARNDFYTIKHPFLLSLFLGKDNLGGYIPSQYNTYRRIKKQKNCI